MLSIKGSDYENPKETTDEKERARVVKIVFFVKFGA